MRSHHQFRTGKTSLAARLVAARLVAVCLATGGLALTAGCSAAPAGAINNSPALGPVRTGAALENFAQFPVSAKWSGESGKDYTVVVKAETGAAPHKSTFTAASSMVFWLNCIGTGTARIVSPAMRVNWSVPCGTGADPRVLPSPRRTPSAVPWRRRWSPPHLVRTGKSVSTPGSPRRQHDSACRLLGAAAPSPVPQSPTTSAFAQLA